MSFLWALITNLPTILTLGTQLVTLIGNLVHPSQVSTVVAAAKQALVNKNHAAYLQVHQDIADGKYKEPAGGLVDQTGLKGD